MNQPAATPYPGGSPCTASRSPSTVCRRRRRAAPPRDLPPIPQVQTGDPGGACVDNARARRRTAARHVACANAVKGSASRGKALSRPSGSRARAAANSRARAARSAGVGSGRGGKPNQRVAARMRACLGTTGQPRKVSSTASIGVSSRPIQDMRPSRKRASAPWSCGPTGSRETSRTHSAEDAPISTTASASGWPTPSANARRPGARGRVKRVAGSGERKAAPKGQDVPFTQATRTMGGFPGQDASARPNPINASRCPPKRS